MRTSFQQLFISTCFANKRQCCVEINSLVTKWVRWVFLFFFFFFWWWWAAWIFALIHFHAGELASQRPNMPSPMWRGGQDGEEKFSRYHHRVDVVWTPAVLQLTSDLWPPWPLIYQFWLPPSSRWIEVHASWGKEEACCSFILLQDTLDKTNIK